MQLGFDHHISQLEDSEYFYVVPFFFILWRIYWVIMNAAVRLMLTSRFHCSREMSSIRDPKLNDAGKQGTV